MMRRWTFSEEVPEGLDPEDEGALPDFTFPVNPSSMQSPEMIEIISAEPRNVDGTNRDTQQPVPPMTWGWEGVLYTLAELDAMEEWLERGHLIRVTDHFNRTWRIQFESLEAERNPSHIYPERHRYTASAFMLGEVTP